MDITERITIDPSICHGKPCIRGLRYPVENVLEWLAGGMSIEDILNDYEDIEKEDIFAALAYAARIVHVKRIDSHAA
ncbi:Asr2172 protein [hydrothermal vent metagenome]|uniref:Asr2172 protein n=1 Tax=hydrothermal vent metagenome TaxID=652676 RepID=A0A3B1BPS1_9ZZZZ